MEKIWLVEDIFPESQSLINNLQQLGKKVLSFDYKPGFLPPLDKSVLYIYHGSLQTAKLLEDAEIGHFGIFASLPYYSCIDYYPYINKVLLNWKNSYFTSIDNFLNGRFCWPSEKLFIRPNSGYKPFIPFSFTKQDFKVRRQELSNLNDADFVLIAPHKNIQKEWRVFLYQNNVGDSEYLSSCQYLPEMIKDTPQDVIDLAKYASNLYCADTFHSVDICESDGELYVLEINSFSCAGLYVCDTTPIINKIEEHLDEYISS